MKIPKETTEMLIELGIAVLKSLREWNKTESQEKGDTDANRPEDIQRDN